MVDERPAIPEAIKREVRQQCYFGCAICGMPFFQYDHIQEYSEVKEHKSNNLILLCPNHHSAKTTGKLSKDRIREAKRKPHNSNRPFTSSFKLEHSKQIKILLGNNEVIKTFETENGEHHGIWINGFSFLTIHSENSWLTVSLAITDDTGKILLAINKGELHATTAQWDYVYEGDNITVRAGLRKILLDIKLSDNKLEVLKGSFFDNGSDGYKVDNGTLINYTKGQPCGWFQFSTAVSNGFGSWGTLNTTRYPNIPEPRGFGFFRKC
jgi:hypothetical protein